MIELTFNEIEATAGGRPGWLFVYDAVVDFIDGFQAGWRDGGAQGGLDGWTMPNGESLPT
jgi:hypothetical protein